MPGFELQFGIKQYTPDGSLVDGPHKELMPALTTFTFLIGCLMGSAFVSWMADRFGRKSSILFGGFIFLVGGIFQTASYGMAAFLFGRWVSGLAIGISSVVCPLYIAEASPTNIRGMMVTIQQLMITIGTSNDRH
jgi:MFS family permease